MRRLFATLLCLTATGEISAASPKFHVSSPDGRIFAEIIQSNPLRYNVICDGHTVLSGCAVDMFIEGRPSLGESTRAMSATRRSLNNSYDVPLPEKRRRVTDRCNELTVKLQNSYSVIFRAYDDGIAYRIQTGIRDSVTVTGELARIDFATGTTAWFPRITQRPDADIFHTAFEEDYLTVRTDTLSASDMAYLPVLAAPDGCPKVGIVESDLEDYPGMFLRGCGANALEAVFAPYPIEETLAPGEYPDRVVTRRAPYIARTAGTRAFPWRIMIIARDDRELPSSDIAWRLASPSRLGDTSWLRPIKGTDEWIPGINLFGVPFRAGINTETYLFYIDFAKRHGFSHIMMDAGWSSVTDPLSVIPEIDMARITEYARRNDIGICLWTLAYALDSNTEEILSQFRRWGVRCIMTDFINRDDQQAVRFVHRTAEACAKHGIQVMFHGVFPGKGFDRTWPNATGREGVLGAEYNIWSSRANPDHDLLLPFTRMLAGAMDYEPGLLNNATSKGFREIPEMVMSQGTRCHQLAMFAVYDSPVQIFSGNPSQAATEERFTKFLAAVPTTWDQTVIVDARVGRYIVTARKKGEEWYIAGMNCWQPHDYAFRLDFLAPGNYKAVMCRDGINADRYAADYVFETLDVSPEDTVSVHGAPGGGFLMRLVKQD